MTQEHGAQLRLIMNHAASVFSAKMTESQAAALSHNPLVESVEEVALVHASEIQTVPPPAPLNWMNLWNLDRLDQWSTIGSNMYQFCERAADVVAYVPDFGVLATHDEFLRPDGTSRVRRGACFADDCNGNGGDIVVGDANYNHGTAVASVLGGRTVGVAKDIIIVPIRISAFHSNQTPASSTERLCWGLDWIRSSDNPDRAHRPAVVSLSVYARANDPLIGALEYVINGLVLDDPATGWTGIPVVVSANNQGSDTCDTSPARMAYRNAAAIARPGLATPGHVISVGGTAQAYVDGVLTDVRWQTSYGLPNWYTEFCVDANGTAAQVDPGSNHGNRVDIYAPADAIEAADTGYWDENGQRVFSTSHYRTRLKSGTSFAAPLVAGLAARILAAEPTLTPVQVWERIRDSAQVVATPFDTTGVDQNGNPTSNSLLAVRRYTSPSCTVTFP